MTPQAFVSSSIPWKVGSSTHSQLNSARRLCPTSMSADSSSSSSSATKVNKASPPPVPSKPASPFKSAASWSKDFFPGFGRKGPGSNPNWDLRPKHMREKGSTTTVVCDSCKGTGVITCTFCEGITFKDKNGNVVDCPACGNKKEITCTACFGTGKQVELKENWWVRGLAAQFFED